MTEAISQAVAKLEAEEVALKLALAEAVEMAEIDRIEAHLKVVRRKIIILVSKPEEPKPLTIGGTAQAGYPTLPTPEVETLSLGEVRDLKQQGEHLWAQYARTPEENAAARDEIKTRIAAIQERLSADRVARATLDKYRDTSEDEQWWRDLGPNGQADVLHQIVEKADEQKNASRLGMARAMLRNIQSKRALSPKQMVWVRRAYS